MVEKEPQTWTWVSMVLPSLLVGAITFVSTMVAFKAKSSAVSKAQERELEIIQKDISRLEIHKADNEKFTGVWAEIKRIDSDKANKEVVNMLVQQLQSIDSKVTEILTRMP